MQQTPEVLKWANYLHQAKNTKQPVQYIKEHKSDLSVDEAYAIQKTGISLREQEGETFSALKMGLTSEAKRQQMNLFSAIYGRLTDKMLIPNLGTFSLNNSIHPKIEPEIAFYVSQDCDGSSSDEHIRKACSQVAPALEILDSRFTVFKYFSLEDVIADNASSSYYVLGPAMTWNSDLEVKDLGMRMSVDGSLVQEGSSSAISGNPFRSIVDLVHLLSKEQETLKAGQWVLAGAATPAFALKQPCTVELEVEHLGKVSVSVEGELS